MAQVATGSPGPWGLLARTHSELDSDSEGASVQGAPVGMGRVVSSRTLASAGTKGTVAPWRVCVCVCVSVSE